MPLRRPRLAPGQRVYAIGDVHGRLDLLEAVAGAIEDDNARRGPAESTVIMLGDLVDRGPQSAGVIEMVREWAAARRVRVIAGNHEELFLRGFDDANALRGFVRFGGVETLASYGIDPAILHVPDLAPAQRMMAQAVPQVHRDFLAGFEKLIVMGDYLFVHAGVDPARPLEDQHESDCRWIREPFLSHRDWLGCMVVHGHTITEDVDIRTNRIGIDTGAFASGRLTAIGLEGEQRWLIQSETTGSAIRTFARAA